MIHVSHVLHSVYPRQQTLSSFHFLIVPFCKVFSLPVLLFKNEIKGLKN